ncbi:MAG: hypothetical protein ABI655_11110 [Phenylobacterium sp.]
MDPISNVDRLVFLLRQRLLERAKAGPATRAQKVASGERAAAGLDHIHALAAIDGVDDRQLRRALVQNILADQFGASLLNEAKFQQVVDRVTETIEGDGGASKLLTRLVGELRASAR